MRLFSLAAAALLFLPSIAIAQDGVHEVGLISCDTNAQSLPGQVGDFVSVQCPAGCGAAPVWGTWSYTDDSSVCAAAIHAGYLTTAGGWVTLVIQGEQAFWESSTMNGIASREWGPWARGFWFFVEEGGDEGVDEPPIDLDTRLPTGDKGPYYGVPTATPPAPAPMPAPGLAMPIDCWTNATSHGGGPGSTLTVNCPPGCASGGSVWGTGIYSDDSAICVAAIHAGALSNAGGAVTVTIREGLSSYPSSYNNGVTTSDWGSWHRSFSLSGGALPAPGPAGNAGMPLSCDQTAQSLPGDPGASFSVSCPTGCGSQTIWGSGIYSDDSSICTAGIHAGVISWGGGAFRVTIREGQSSYPSSSQNGVTSSDWGSWGRSFVVSP